MGKEIPICRKLHIWQATPLLRSDDSPSEISMNGAQRGATQWPNARADCDI
jgi:hypothetical protein